MGLICSQPMGGVVLRCTAKMLTLLVQRLGAKAAVVCPGKPGSPLVGSEANGRILSAVGERLGLPAGRVVDCIGQYGNTSAATLPLALAFSEREGMLAPGDRVLLGAFGAGFTWGATVLEWGRH